MTRFIYLFLSLFLVLSGVTQANAASSWSITNVVSAGSRVIVTASKGGLKSAVNIAPSAARLALSIGKTANTASLIYAISQAIPKAVDYVLDPANNTIKYTIPNGSRRAIWSIYDSGNQPTAEIACQVLGNKAFGVGHGRTVTVGTSPYACLFNGNDFGYITSGKLVKTVPISDITPDVIANAAAGHSDSQAATRAAAIEMVVAGDFDKDLLAGAVPTTDSRPLVPSVPISGNGNVAVGDTDSGMTGGDVGQAADDSRKAADDARKAAQAAADAAKAAAEAAREAADDAQDLINSGADTAAIDAAKAAQAAAEKAAADAKAVSDAAVAAANERAAAAERAAEAATQAATQAAAQAAKDLDAAKAAGDAAAIAAAQAAKAAADAALADAKAKQEAAEKAAEKAKAEAAKPFELPAFCTWASKVCDLADWVMKDGPLPPDTPIPEQTMEVKDPEVFDKSYINVSAECPSDIQKSIPIGTNSFSLVIPMTPVCDFGSTVIKPVIIFIAFIQAALMIGTVFKVG